MGEKCLPYSKLNLMHEVNDKHLWQIETAAELLIKRILSCTE